MVERPEITRGSGQAVEPLAFLTGGGSVGALLRARDWSRRPLGPPETWPQSLRTMVAACLNSPLPGTVLWGPDLLMLYNDAYVVSLGDRHPGALGSPVAEVWGDTWEQTAAPFHVAMQTGEGFEQRGIELSVVHDGAPKSTWWNISATPIRGEDGSVVGLWNQAVEITAQVEGERARLRAEEELRALNAHLEKRIDERTAALLLHENIIQSHNSPVCAFDLDYRLIAFNRAHSDGFFRIFGHRVRIGEVFPDLFPPEQASVMRGFMTRALAGETYTVVEEFGDPDLVKPYWEVSYYPLRDADGKIMGAFHHANDISTRLRAQAELEAAREALRQSQKMEAVGQLTGGVAHDFNNLLTVIRTSIDLLQRPGLAEERRPRFLDAISGAVARATKLTGQLLAFARRQALQPVVFDAASNTRAITEMIGTLVGARVAVELVLPDAPCFVNADPSQFDTSLVNMAVNARDAMDGTGKLTIRVALASRIPSVRSAPAAGGPFVAVSIADTGIGIPPHQLDQIFEPFFTTKQTGMGTGLGLSQVFGFARQSGGDILVTSTVGEGSTLTLYLPQVGAPMPEVERLEAQDAGYRPGGLVLVVEDNASVAESAEQTLQALGYATKVVSDAAQALAELGARAGAFVAVFSDVVMPGMSGIELARLIESRLPDLPVVLSSGYAYILTQRPDHGFTLLSKPYSVDDLSRVLGNAIQGRRRKE